MGQSSGGPPGRRALRGCVVRRHEKRAASASPKRAKEMTPERLPRYRRQGSFLVVLVINSPQPHALLQVSILRSTFFHLRVPGAIPHTRGLVLLRDFVFLPHSVEFGVGPDGLLSGRRVAWNFAEALLGSAS